MRRKTVISLICILTLCLASTGFVSAKTVKAKSVSLNVKSVTVSEGSAVSLNASITPKKSTEKIKWVTSNKDVATVAKDGTVQGVSKGTAVITAKTSKSGKDASCTVTVERYLTNADVTESIKSDESVREEIIKAVNETVISEDGIIALIQKYAPAGGSTTIINNNTGEGLDWADGTELTLYKSTKNNLSIPGDFPVIGRTSDVGKLTEATIKKYHYDEYIDGDLYPFKYVIDFKGSLPETYTDVSGIMIELFDSNMTEQGEYCLTFGIDDHRNWSDITWTMEGNNFSVHAEYYAWKNYSIFIPRFGDEF